MSLRCKTRYRSSQIATCVYVWVLRTGHYGTTFGVASGKKRVGIALIYEAARAQGTPIAVSPAARRAIEQKLGLGRAYDPIDDSLLHVPTDEDIRIVKAKDKRHDKRRCVAKEKRTPAAASDAAPSN